MASAAPSLHFSEEAFVLAWRVVTTVATLTFVQAGLVPWQVLDRKKSVVHPKQRLWALARLSVLRLLGTLHPAPASAGPVLLRPCLLLVPGTL